MENNKNVLPALPSGEELEAKAKAEGLDFLPEDDWQSIDIADDWLDVTEAYQRPRWTLAYNGVPFAPLGGIHALTGQPGHGKTMTFTQIMVAILKGQYGNLSYELADEAPEPKVLYIDTEMEKGNTQLVNLRVYSLMGWSYGVPHDEFKVIMLRETENAVDRWRKTLKAIYEVKPTVCFIDGLLDVVNDFNDNKECAEIIYKCMKVASHYGISLWCLVHENPGSTKMVGHMGSVLERKVTDAFGTIKDKDAATGSVTFTVRQKKARGKDVPDWQFKVVDDANNFGVPTQISESETIELQQSEADSINTIMLKYVPRPGCISSTQLQKAIKTGERIGSTKAYDMILKAQSLEIIEKASNGKYIYIGGKPTQQPEEIFTPNNNEDEF